MSVELARKQLRTKPWGVDDLGPWADAEAVETPIGEISFERSNAGATTSSLLLKLLFTNQPLSVQVHPDDDYARSIGQPNGKTESWYVLKADHGAKVALGLDRTLTPQQLRQSIDDGSISQRIVWQTVVAGDALYVPAGTIHAIGAGLVIAEVQQRSDTTFRLFDHGLQRELHVDNAVAAAKAGAAVSQARTERLSDGRTLLVACPHFVFERIILEPDTTWTLRADRETWLLVIGGDGRTEAFEIATGDALFAQADSVEMHTGEIGLVALVAYTGATPVHGLLQQVQTTDMSRAAAPRDFKLQVSTSQPSTVRPNTRIGTTA